jgi:hypothetical protein
MNLQELQLRNEKFQKAAARVHELLPGENMLGLSSLILRSSKKIDRYFPMLLQAPTELKFHSLIEKIEEEIDEVVFGLDRMYDINRRKRVPQIDDFIKFGYDLLSIYSLGCDKMIERRIKKEV